MRRLGRWLRRLLAALVAVAALLLVPVAWVELACRGTPVEGGAAPLIADPAWQRPESRTLMTYPEWSIVHAYQDYARVIGTGDPHEFGFLQAIRSFWNPLCPLKRAAMELGPVPLDSKLTIYTIGVSFTAEMLLKAAYEESLGRAAAWLRGPGRAAMDELTGAQAALYADFLRQVPWYRYDFAADRAELLAAGGSGLRDRERRVAIGTEYAAKAAYARLIAQGVAGIGPDALRMRSVLRGIGADALAGIEGVEVIGPVPPSGLLVETPRYRAFTELLLRLARTEADLVEIAGNDVILLSALSDRPAVAGALRSVPLQGASEWRHLFLVPVPALLDTLRAMPAGGLRLEHVYDY
ncbi:hypothetical protein [Wenxinia saemankumensis]|uniref:Uncharacterized protein n=1 Tax=Wenxinia saemankumensis TaxID=1447782 RepID=A0A1M6FWA4_9RHOB|nr:hypothetical protein [Wenxinia saemankumensis]SHJ01962.1 hypothetical protein SAMN05444417_2537 [Wenxinia saemankumensis]